MDSLQRESDLLLESRERAKRVLADSAAKARERLDEAHRNTLDLLIDQQQRAAALLLSEGIEAVRVRDEAVASTKGLDAEEAVEFMASHDAEALDLLERQRIAAQLLLSAQEKAAAMLDAAVAMAISDILIAGQKQAAAILLEAKERVEGARVSPASDEPKMPRS